MNTETRKLIAKFHERHGPDFARDGNFIFYADGAFRELTPYGVMAPPPDATSEEGEFELHTNIVKFWTIKHAKAVAEFEELKQWLNHTNPEDPDAEIAKLRRLATAVKETTAQLRKAEERLAKTRRGRARAMYERGRDEERDEQANFRDRVREIRI